MISPINEDYTIEEKMMGQLGDGFYIYKKGKLWGWAHSIEEANGLIRDQAVKDDSKKFKKNSFDIPF